ncbi:CarD family transcriptional regulator [Sediminicoccus sp. KRV36]|uniref:CarD family transcriptional regulator n=1 Tax=Sediminicoccus sp. KRV36 TaxID=3133721 RepID=UPI00200F8571|nr:CarD family transcriptional regulator [Sediminicoccus rosea]UPY37719.1 CarD family transcriptional regulator [Sediminicoccus rosea]
MAKPAAKAAAKPVPAKAKATPKAAAKPSPVKAKPAAKAAPPPPAKGKSSAARPAPAQAKPAPVTAKAAPKSSPPTSKAPSKKATPPPVTKSKAVEAKSDAKSDGKSFGKPESKPAAEKVTTPAATPTEKPAAAVKPPAAPAPAAVPEAVAAGPRPSIVVAAPPNMPIRNTGNPMSPRPPMGRPNMPPSFAVRSPGRPGFAEGQAVPPRPPGPKVEFKAGDHVVYPTHGVGTVQGIEVIEVAGTDHHMIVVTFDENRMTLRVPVNKVPTAGLRKLFTQKEFEAAIDTLKGRARIKRTMWSRRAQEYEAKINSGDPIQIAEVVRDLQRNAGQPDQSFSERQIYEQALERLAAEYAAIEKIDKLAASDQLVVFAKST